MLNVNMASQVVRWGCDFDSPKRNVIQPRVTIESPLDIDRNESTLNASQHDDARRSLHQLNEVVRSGHGQNSSMNAPSGMSQESNNAANQMSHE